MNGRVGESLEETAVTGETLEEAAVTAAILGETAAGDGAGGDGKRQKAAWKALKRAFPYTIPIFAGFWFLGISYGIYMGVSGFSFVYPMVMATVIFGGSLLSAVVGLVVGIPALRLKGDYLAIITLGFGMIIVNVINNLPFAGGDGLGQGTASAALYESGLGFSTKTKVAYLCIALLVTIICVAMMFMFVRSKYGRAIEAIRDDEIAASASGIDTSRYKILTFTYSAFFAGIAGALYSCTNSALSTSSFAFTNSGIINSIFIVVMVVLGGMGSLTGSILAAVIMFFVNYQIKNGAWVAALPGFLKNVFGYPMMVYAVILVVIIIFRPKGIFGKYEFSIVHFKSDIQNAFKKRGGGTAEGDNK